MAFRSVLAKLVTKSEIGRTRSVANNSTKYLWDDDYYQKEMLDRIEDRRNRNFLLSCRYRPDDVYPPHPKATDDPNVMAYAHFAVQEFNKRKNARLEFVRAVRAYCQETRPRNWGVKEEGCGDYYYLTLEAVDAQVVKTYQAIVNDIPHPWLFMFGHVADDHNATRTLLEEICDGPDWPAVCRQLDEREDRPNKELKVSLLTKKGYFLEDWILGSLQAPPSNNLDNCLFGDVYEYENS